MLTDRNPGPYLYPKKCHWSLVPSSIKETDSCNKEGPYQISAREPRQPQGQCKKAFMRARDPRQASETPGALTLVGGNAAGHSH